MVTFCVRSARFVPIRWVGPGNKLFQWSFNVSVYLIAEDLSQSAGYEQLQWSFNLSVCLIASDLSRYGGYDYTSYSSGHILCEIRSVGPGYDLCDVSLLMCNG